MPWPDSITSTPAQQAQRPSDREYSGTRCDRPGLSPLQRERKSGKTTITKQAHGIEILVLHQTTGNRVGSAINTFTTNFEGATAKVGGKSITGKRSLHSGSQFILDVDGHFIRMADDRYFTQHGGGSFGYKKRKGKRKPFWAGGGEINERALGIEIAHGDKGKDSDLKASPYDEAQYVAAIDLAKEVKKTYGVRSQDIVGHQDVTGKVRCPGPHLHWERLETDGATLKPRPLAKADIDAMFGGFFAGTDGAKRKLKFDDKAEAIAAGKFRIVRGEEEIATGLASSPLEGLNLALEKLGYGVFLDTINNATNIQRFHFDTAYCVGQFIRHYCTGARFLASQKGAYSQTESKFFIDLELARLVHGAFLEAK